MSRNWSESEVEAAVEDYFDMLRLELSGQKFIKAHHRRNLMKRLNDRSESSVEWKHQNISAALIEMGIPCIDGYKPGANYQRLISHAVDKYLKRNPEFEKLFEEKSVATPAIPSVDDLLSTMEEAPSRARSIRSRRTTYPISNNPTRVNYLEIEAQNQWLGNAGEEFIINFEHARLIRAGQESLADRIERVSETEGPSAGYDILSYEKSGKERLIEVKTTTYGKSTPFFVTKNELAFSQKNSSRYFLYRLFKFGPNPRIFKLHGHLQNQCNLEPSVFIAKTL